MMPIRSVFGIEANHMEIGVREKLDCVRENRLKGTFIPKILDTEDSEKSDPRFLTCLGWMKFFLHGQG